MGTVEFEIERTVNAPIEQVFARLIDIEAYGDWMPRKGSMLKRTRQTSPGLPGLGTTYEDETSFGKTPGEISEFDAPRTVVFHWWEATKGGKVKMEGWPGYSLESLGDATTRVRHHLKLQAHGIWRAGLPLLHRLTRRERTTTINALAASFE